MLTVQTEDVIIDIDGNTLVGPKETLIILDFVSIFSFFLSQIDIYFFSIIFYLIIFYREESKRRTLTLIKRRKSKLKMKVSMMTKKIKIGGLDILRLMKL